MHISWNLLPPSFFLMLTQTDRPVNRVFSVSTGKAQKKEKEKREDEQREDERLLFASHFLPGLFPIEVSLLVSKVERAIRDKPPACLPAWENWRLLKCAQWLPFVATSPTCDDYLLSASYLPSLMECYCSWQEREESQVGCGTKLSPTFSCLPLPHLGQERGKEWDRDLLQLSHWNLSK